jgi:hypothetical protein
MMMAFLLVAAVAGGGGTAVEVETDWVPEGTAEFSFHAGERELCRFSGRAPEGSNLEKGRCRFEIPAGTREIEVRGSFERNTWLRREQRVAVRAARGAQSFRLRDLSALSRPLRHRDSSWSERITRSLAAQAAIAPGFEGEELLAVVGAPVAALELDQAEQRLGGGLPAGYRALMQEVGPVSLGSASIVRPSELETFDRTLVSWGYRSSGRWLEWMSEAMLARAARAVMLFSQPGDGTGAQLLLLDQGQACGDELATILVHDDSMAEDLQRLVRAEVECTTFEALLLAWHARSVIDGYKGLLVDEEGEAPQVLIDSSAEQTLHLRYETDERGTFDVRLE